MLFLSTALSLALFAPAASAAVKFRNGPTFTDEGATLNVTGDVSGLGKEDLTVFLTATGVATVECYNPAGHRAPGQDTTVTTTGTVSDIEVKNGRARFDLSTDEATVGSEACPNRKWTAVVIDVDFSEARLRLEQDGETVFNRTYTL